MIFFRPSQKRRAALYQEVFTPEPGKRVLADLIEQNFIFNTTQGADPYETAFREGRRAVVLAILARLRITPDQLRAMETDGREYDDDSTGEYHGI